MDAFEEYNFTHNVILHAQGYRKMHIGEWQVVPETEME